MSVCLSERRRLAAGLSGCGEVLPRYTPGVPESDWFVFNRGGADEHGRGREVICNESLYLFSKQHLCLGLSLLCVAGCEKKVVGPGQSRCEHGHRASPDHRRDRTWMLTISQVDHPEQFPLATAGEHTAAPELNVTGVVNPDVSRQVPVPSLATGRIVEIDARLGDEVKKGQLLFKVRSTDIAGAFSNYRQAVKNEQLTKSSWIRANTAVRQRRLSEERSGNRPECRGRQPCRPRDREGTTRTAGSRPRASHGHRRGFRSGIREPSPTRKSPISRACRL